MKCKHVCIFSFICFNVYGYIFSEEEKREVANRKYLKIGRSSLSGRIIGDFDFS